MKIKHKLGLLFALLILIPISIAAIVAISWGSESFEHSAIHKLKSAIELSAQELSIEFSVVHQMLDVYVNTPEIQSRDSSLFLPYLRNELARVKPRYEQFIFGMPDGSFYNTAGGNPHKGMLRSFDDNNSEAPLQSIIKRDYWLATIGNNTMARDVTFVSQPMLSYTTGARQIVVAKSIISEGSVAGLLAVSFSWQRIESHIKKLSNTYFAHFDWPARLILTDKEGNYWHHWNPNKVVQHLSDEYGEMVIDSRSKTISPVSNIKNENIKALSKTYNKPIKSGVQTLPFNTERGNEKLYFIYKIIPESNYVIGVIVNRNEVIRPFSQLREKYTWLFVLMLSMSSLAVIYIARSLSRPIEKLTQAIEALSDGETLPIGRNQGSQELKSLNIAFENMRNKLLQKESALTASERRLNYAMQGANDGLWDWNLDNDEVFYSPRWITMLGYTPKNFEHKLSSLLQLLHPGDHVKWELAVKNCLSEKQEKFRIIIRLKHREGHYIYVLSRAFSVKDDATGEPIRLVGTHVDISEQVAFEEKIKALNSDLEKRVEARTQDLVFAKDAALKAQAEAEVASHAKSRFLANMSHELRTPLNSINGFTDRLIQRLEGKIEPRHMDALKTIARNGRQLLNIINDILDTQNIDSGDITLKYSLVLIPELFDQLARSYKEKADKKDIDLVFSYPSDIDHRCIYADPIRIRQILSNLLNNALKFTETGKVSITALVANHQEQQGMRFDVQDTGLGIDISVLDSLFSPFTQADDSASRPISGTGLGLTLVKLLTEMHNGVVTVSSELGKGSTFSVWIPSQTS